ncbi:probable LRR receptor-like serine/threonine-protein kinase At3g47570 isoform X2 [Rosa chinensis]|uniref:probable LRR receptor-like serine/threonine-protein kinase At3g47570 isoform X2 n=1 Tax=Rosa chinensis TaxID=74649 RepID=UPI000D094016|nr:probable LRR receptor-like serine/threonine-protein kinase At3g47570 isoform X2 [Rosa chinensis]
MVLLHECAFWFICVHVITHLFLINFFLPTTTAANAFGNETDRLALLKFKESIVADPHGFLNSWNGSVHFCNWHGITCRRRHQRVTALNLPDADLDGTISPYIGNLSFLRTFRLLNNSFSGKIPQQVDHLFRLRHLNLSSNMLEGEIPVSLTFCSKLSIISIASNRLTGKIPSEIGSLMKLLHLDLQKNNLTGGIPPSLGNLSSITLLSLQYNHLVGNIPEEIGRLRSLSTFAIGANKLSGIIPASFGKLQKLQELYLNSNRLSGRIPSSLGNLTQLSRLWVFENELEGSIPPNIGNCPNLREMDISHNKLSGDIPSQVIGLSFSVLLKLAQNSLTGILPAEVGKLKNINILDISDNNLTGGIPDVIGGCQVLEFLLLQGNLFQGIIPTSLATLRGLQYLDLSRNNLSGHIPKDLQRLSFLIYLNLSSNNLEGEVPKEGVFRNKSALSLDGNTKLCGGISELQLPACPIKVPKQRKLHGFKLKFTISLVAGCSLLFAVILALYWGRKTQKKKPLSTVSSINFISRVSYQTLHQATGGFSTTNQIGSGSFGCVYKGILDQEQNNVVAIKVLNLQQKGAYKSFMAECNALRNIRHRNLVKILTCCSSIDYNGNEFKALVYEYMSNGSLEKWLHRENQSRSLTLLQRLNIVIDTALALCYLHDHCEPHIIHGDMKPSNVLLDDDMVAHVGDFGLARLIPPTTDSYENKSSTVGIKGTIGYAAPEYAVGAESSKQGDVYSYGILVLELFTGKRPTDEMFIDNCNIHTFVKTSIQGRLMQIVDPTLIATLEETATSTTNNEASIHGYNNEIEVDEDSIDNENLSMMNTYVWKCILPTLKIGLACSEESPRNRVSMEDVHRELHHIKNAYTGVDIRRERSKRS